MTCDPYWTSCLSALLTPIIACFGIYIAYRQWTTAQKKLKHELFDRRFSVYDVTRNFLSSILTSGRVKEEEQFKFLLGTREAKWLLSIEVAEYLEKELYHKTLYMQALASELDAIHAEFERKSNIQKQFEIKRWISLQYDVLDTKFSPFLKLTS